MSANNAIGTGAVVLTAGLDPMTAGLEKAKGDLRKWAGDAAKAATPAAGGMKQAGGGMAAALAGGLKGGPAIAAIAAGALALKETVGSVFETIGDMGKEASTAKSFGIDPSTFSAMAGVAKSAGSDVRDFTESLVTMSSLGKNAAAGTEEAAKAFKTLGLNAAQFNAMGVEQQYYAMMDALAGVTNEQDRLALAGKAFGEDGMKNVIPLIGKTSDELRQMGEAYRTSAADIAAVTKANDAMKSAGNALSMLWRKVVIAIAPVIEVGANALAKFAPVFDWIGRAAQGFFAVVGAVFGEVVDAVSGAVSAVAEWGAAVLGIGAKFPTVESVIIGAFEAIGKAGGYVFDNMARGIGLVAVGLGKLIEGTAGVADGFLSMAKAIPEDIRPKWAADLIAFGDAVTAKTKEIGGAVSEWGGQQMERNVGQTAEAVGRWFDRLRQKMKGGGDATKPVAGMKDDAPGITGPPKLASAMQAGSAEAAKAINQFKAGGITGGDVQKKLLDETRNNGKLLERLIDKITEALPTGII